MKAIPTLSDPVRSLNGEDANSSRRSEHSVGSLLSVRDQGARNCNEEMRRIYVVPYFFFSARICIAHSIRFFIIPQVTS